MTRPAPINAPRYSLFAQPNSLAEKLLSALSSKLLVWLYTNSNILLLHFLQLLQSAHFNGTPHRNLDLALSIRMNCWQLQVSFKNLKEDGTNRGLQDSRVGRENLLLARPSPCPAPGPLVQSKLVDKEVLEKSLSSEAWNKIIQLSSRKEGLLKREDVTVGQEAVELICKSARKTKQNETISL